jgi:hypothetical protein
MCSAHRKYALRREISDCAEKFRIAQRKYLLRGENIRCAEKIFVARRKYALRSRFLLDFLKNNFAAAGIK